jgi:hypothetical protein
MSAGLSQKVIKDRVRRRLYRIQKELAAAGVNTVYRVGTRSAASTLVYQENPQQCFNGTFLINYNVSNASNGETFGVAAAQVTYKGESKRYHLGAAAGTFEQGIARIKELFAVKS